MDDVADPVALMSRVKIWSFVVDCAARSLDLYLTQNISRLGRTPGPCFDLGLDLDILPVLTEDVNASVHAGNCQLVRLCDGDAPYLAGVLLLAPAPVRMVLVGAGAVTDRPA